MLLELDRLCFFLLLLFLQLFCSMVVNSESDWNSYVLEFDDDEEDGSLPQRTVPFRKVVPLPEGHRQ